VAPVSEARVQSQLRLRAAQTGKRLWRNNVGVLKDQDGRPVRFGLANDAPNVNKVLKSGDLIGYESIVITPDMVGQRIARFLSVECKAEDWKPSPTDEREKAQRNWADIINKDGGRAIFATSADQL
jgi:hypothetical protein